MSEHTIPEPFSRLSFHQRAAVYAGWRRFQELHQALLAASYHPHTSTPFRDLLTNTAKDAAHAVLHEHNWYLHLNNELVVKTKAMPEDSPAGDALTEALADSPRTPSDFLPRAASPLPQETPPPSCGCSKSPCADSPAEPSSDLHDTRGSSRTEQEVTSTRPHS
ncbi:MAG: hypothetical protein Q8O14_14700 [bacterium]|nr:hypothetical protein [bacterium]